MNSFAIGSGVTSHETSITISILIPCLHTGGTEVATLETARALQVLGLQVDVVIYFDEVDPLMHNTFQAAGVTIHPLGLRPNGGRLDSLRLAWVLWRQLRSRRHHLIWLQYMTPTLVPLLVSRFFTRRLVAAVHVAYGHYSKRGLTRLRWLARVWCDCFVCVSETTARGIFGPDAKGNVAKRRVEVIHNAIDMATVEASCAWDWRSELNLPADAFVIGYVGRLAHNKGVDVLLRAMPGVIASDPRVILIVVGDGTELNSLKALVGELGLTDKIYFVGAVPREAIYSAFKGFDLSVVPSREEGFGLSALEAMAAGVPLVASDVDALSEVVINGQTGLLFNPEDSSDLATKLRALIEDKGLRQRLSSAGIAHVSRMYDRSAYQARMKALLHGMGLTTRADP